MEPQEPQTPVSETDKNELGVVQVPSTPALSNKTPLAEKSALSKIGLPQNLKLALLIFFLSASAILVILPRFFGPRAATTDNASSGVLITPPFRLFVLAGLVMVGLTAMLFSYLSRLNLGFNRAVLVLAFGYNAVLAVIKLFLSPSALYFANQRNTFNTQFGNPNNIFYYFLTGTVILLLYLLVFRFMYRYSRQRVESKSYEVDADALVLRKSRTRRTVLLILLILGALGGGGAIIFLPFLLLGPSIAYLSYVFESLGIVVGAALILAIVLARTAFREVEKQTIASGNAALLASLFWLGFSLILLYHIMWVIFMATLVSIWPFSTYTPK